MNQKVTSVETFSAIISVSASRFAVWYGLHQRELTKLAPQGVLARVFNDIALLVTKAAEGLVWKGQGEWEPYEQEALRKSCLGCVFGKFNNGVEVRCSSPDPLPPAVIQKTSASSWTLASAAADCPHYRPVVAKLGADPLPVEGRNASPLVKLSDGSLVNPGSVTSITLQRPRPNNQDYIVTALTLTGRETLCFVGDIRAELEALLFPGQTGIKKTSAHEPK